MYLKNVLKRKENNSIEKEYSHWKDDSNWWRKIILEKTSNGEENNYIEKENFLWKDDKNN